MVARDLVLDRRQGRALVAATAAGEGQQREDDDDSHDQPGDRASDGSAKIHRLGPRRGPSLLLVGASLPDGTPSGESLPDHAFRLPPTHSARPVAGLPTWPSVAGQVVRPGELLD